MLSAIFINGIFDVSDSISGIFPGGAWSRNNITRITHVITRIKINILTN